MSPEQGSVRVLVIDNDDSFVHLLADYCRLIGAEAAVLHCSVLGDVGGAEAMAAAVEAADAVLLSPGPGSPAEAQASHRALSLARRRGLPVLGVCLGHQVIAEAFGARVLRAAQQRHGIPSAIVHDGRGLFQDAAQGFAATRYHSLTVEEASLPAELLVTARSEDGQIMGLRHCSEPIEAVQFHPESILTRGGLELMGRWLAGVPAGRSVSPGLFGA